ncbi:hypothetical protein EX30DRAFT_41199 [Ascodesmis nigricans]|uniref:Uncharacterized protein n=1 Tax=Ascodesmis nigricans TaxID=341454 RepID=A0A4S2MW31_9PEZI|nr:hypothetical protein EX30DRAFT_41199 [Ascodesmis nigricans]
MSPPSRSGPIRLNILRPVICMCIVLFSFTTELRRPTREATRCARRFVIPASHLHQPADQLLAYPHIRAEPSENSIGSGVRRYYALFRQRPSYGLSANLSLISFSTLRSDLYLWAMESGSIRA